MNSLSPKTPQTSEPRKLLRLEFIIGSAGFVPVSRATFYAWIARGLMPPARKLGRIAVWYEDEVVRALHSMMGEKQSAGEDGWANTDHCCSLIAALIASVEGKSYPNFATAPPHRRIASSLMAGCRSTRQAPLPKAPRGETRTPPAMVNGHPNASSN